MTSVFSAYVFKLRPYFVIIINVCVENIKRYCHNVHKIFSLFCEKNAPDIVAKKMYAVQKRRWKRERKRVRLYNAKSVVAWYYIHPALMIVSFCLTLHQFEIFFSHFDIITATAVVNVNAIVYMRVFVFICLTVFSRFNVNSLILKLIRTKYVPKPSTQLRWQ